MAPMLRRLGRFLPFVGLPLLSSAAFAGTGDPIRTNDYSVELVQGPVLAPLRVTGLAGAYAAYAEGVDGLPVNPASPAVRAPNSMHEIDWDLAFSLAFPATFGSTDFDNDGKNGFTYEDFVFYTLGGMIQVGPLGVGVLGDFQRYNLTPNASGDSPRSSLTLGRLDLIGGWAFLDNQLMIGGGARGAWLDISSKPPGQSTQTLLSMVGFAPEAGMLIRPDYQPWRIGATFRAAVDAPARQDSAVVVDELGVRRAASLAIPRTVHLPWELCAGFAIQLGPRPLNPRWIDPGAQEHDARERMLRSREARADARAAELAAIRDDTARARRAEQLDREERYLLEQEERRLDGLEEQMLAERRARYWNWPREYILVVAEALVVGPSSSAVSLESFLSQREQVAGERATVTPRLGFEGEPVVGWLKTRFGTYLEPSRFAGRSARQHFTFGFDIHTFDFKGWGFLAPASYRISAMADLAPRYENLGASFGAWY